MHSVRRATPADAPEAAKLLHDLNTEFDEPTPGITALTANLRRLIDGDEIVVLLGGEGPDGLAQLQFRVSVWSTALDAYLAELYVVPEKRGRGIGRALLEAAIEAARERGAGHLDLNTSIDDKAAIGLYESLGFTNREGSPDGPQMLYYEREL